jgi:hypothetical protein
MPREFSKLCGSTLNENRRLLNRLLLFHNNAGPSARRVVSCSVWVGACRFRIRFALSIGQGMPARRRGPESSLTYQTEIRRTG